jgi:NAD(P)-dependent dehydrogenase (short-subunit alcohol dehydrogenase family)
LRDGSFLESGSPDRGPNSLLLTGRVAFITGAQQGIGLEIALAFARAGADVAVNYLDDATAANRAVETIRAAERRGVAIPGDVSHLDQINSMVASTVEQLGAVDIWVNNAAVYPRSKALELSEEEWDEVVDINLKGSFFGAQAAARRMVAQSRPGAIINMSSVAMQGAINGAHYSSTKGGVVSMTRTLALELAPHGIRVNAIAPGLIDTAQPRVALSDGEIEAIGRATPLGRVGMPGDIANAALFLASDASSFITGQVLHVNGGMYMP